jgi:hypothetical protein
LKLWGDERQTDWDLLLPYALFAYNISYHSLLQETPFYLQFGRDARLTVDIVLGKRPDYTPGVHEYATELVQNLYDVHQRVREILQSVNDKRMLENENESVPEFNIGDEVFLYDPTTTKGLSRKLVQRWKGPYVIIEKHSSVNYKIMKDGRSQVVHVGRLRKKNVVDVSAYEQDLLTIDDELKVIEQSQQRLLERQRETMKNREKVRAIKQSFNNNAPASTDITDNDEASVSEFTFLDVHDKTRINW